MLQSLEGEDRSYKAKFKKEISLTSLVYPISASLPIIVYMQEYHVPSTGIAPGSKRKHTTGGIPRWSPTLVLVARFSAYVWQSGRDAQFSLTYGRMCLLARQTLLYS
jgi:hypothetical protein